MKLYPSAGFAQVATAYGEGAYNSCDYSATSCASASAGGTSGNAGGNGTLVNTGVAVGGIVAIAALILLLAVVVRFWRRPGSPEPAEFAPQEEPADEIDTEAPDQRPPQP